MQYTIYGLQQYPIYCLLLLQLVLYTPYWLRFRRTRRQGIYKISPFCTSVSLLFDDTTAANYRLPDTLYCPLSKFT